MSHDTDTAFAGSDAATPAFVLTPLGKTDAQERGLQLGARGGQVGALLVPGLERALGLTASLLGLLEVDLGRHVGGLGHHDDLVRPHLDEATGDGEQLLLAALADHELPDTKGRQPQPFFVAEVFTGRPGAYVAIKDTVASFKGILEGQADDLPEQAFFLAGTLDDVRENAKKLAA
jgi:hypothetical protein